MTIGDTTVTAMIDSGASVNVLNLESFNLLQSNGLKFQTRKSTSKVFAYGTKTPLPVRGIIEATVNVGPNTCCAEFHVVNTNTCNLLSFTTARQLKLISFNSDHVTCNLQPVPEQTNQTPANDMRYEQIMKQYGNLFEGIGKIKDVKISLHVDPEVKPKQQKHHSILVKMLSVSYSDWKMLTS